MLLQSISKLIPSSPTRDPPVSPVSPASPAIPTVDQTYHIQNAASEAIELFPPIAETRAQDTAFFYDTFPLSSPLPLCASFDAFCAGPQTSPIDSTLPSSTLDNLITSHNPLKPSYTATTSHAPTIASSNAFHFIEAENRPYFNVAEKHFMLSNSYQASPDTLLVPQPSAIPTAAYGVLGKIIL